MARGLIYNHFWALNFILFSLAINNDDDHVGFTLMKRITKLCILRFRDAFFNTAMIKSDGDCFDSSPAFCPVF